MNLSSLETFADALKAKFSLPGSASPEDQLKPVVADLLKSAGIAYGLVVDTRTETHLSDHKVRPDIAVYVGGLIGGYIELKAPGLGADPPKLKGEHNKKQWEKLKGLPNLIYTDIEGASVRTASPSCACTTIRPKRARPLRPR